MATPLARAFLDALRETHGERAPSSIDGLAALLAPLIDGARTQHPSIRVDDVVFGRHLGARVDPALALPEALAQLKIADLLVACGCAVGDRGAIAILEADHVRGAQGALGKRGISAEIAEEANQNVRERLLVGAGRPRILDYDGRGDLKSWVRVVVIREAIYLAKQGKRDLPLSYDLLAAPATADDPESAYFKARYRAEYKQAFETAVEELSSRERAVLRQQIVLGMSIDEIGTVYQVHRATAARWVQSARDELLAKTRRELAIRLNLSRADLENIVRMIESQLVVSMNRLLEATRGD